MLSYEVYKITNKVNGKVYIGITNRGAGARFKQHLFEAEHGSSFRFHNALRKYGADGFDINIISFCKNAEELKEREKFFIKEYDSTNPEKGYNMTEGGDGTFGRPCSEETKQKISIANSGKTASEYTRKLLSEAGKVRTEGRDKYWKSGKIGETRKKPVLQYTLDGDYITEYSGVNEASRKTGISTSLIIPSLKRKRVLISERNPYIWLYKEDYKEIPSKVDPSLAAILPDWKPQISDKCRQANIESRKNKVRTAEELALIKQRATEACGKKVLQYSLDGKLLAEFDSISEASKNTGQDRKTIANSANRKTKVTKSTKFIWRYKE